MQKLQITGNALFDQSAYPVVVERDGRVRYYNAAAETVFRMAGSALREDGSLPGPLAGLEEGEAMRDIGSKTWRIELRRAPEGRCFLLRELPRETGVMSLSRFRMLSYQLRSALDGIAMALSGLERDLVETERLRQEESIARLEQRYHELLLMCWNVDILIQSETENEMYMLYPQSYLDAAGLCRDLVRQAEYLVEATGNKIIMETEKGAGSALVLGHDYLLSLIVCHMIADAVAGLKGTSGQVRVKVQKDRKRVYITVERRGGKDARPLRIPGVIQDPLEPGGLEVPVCRSIARELKGTLATSQMEDARRQVLSLPLTDGKSPLPDHPLRSMEIDYTAGHPPILVALSPQLPCSVFLKREDER